MVGQAQDDHSGPNLRLPAAPAGAPPPAAPGSVLGATTLPPLREGQSSLAAAGLSRSCLPPPSTFCRFSSRPAMLPPERFSQNVGSLRILWGLAPVDKAAPAHLSEILGPCEGDRALGMLGACHSVGRTCQCDHHTFRLFLGGPQSSPRLNDRPFMLGLEPRLARSALGSPGLRGPLRPFPAAVTPQRAEPRCPRPAPPPALALPAARGRQMAPCSLCRNRPGLDRGPLRPPVCPGPPQSPGLTSGAFPRTSPLLEPTPVRRSRLRFQSSQN